nr:metal ABC transporter permease [Kytococcus schroeteri]
MAEMLQFDFMQRALLAALLVGAVAPMVGIFVVQRGLSLIGDALGHVALAGVAVGVVMQAQPVWTALAVAVLAAVVIEALRARGGTASDVALALMFHTGIALGVVLISTSPGTANLENYLFGAITTTSSADLRLFVVLGVVVAVATTLLRPRLFAVAQDEVYSRSQGLPVTALNMLLSALVAVTIVMSMRVVGLLLISALMIVPIATSQLLTRSFAAAWWVAMVLGALSGVGGVVVSYTYDLPSGGTIVLLAVAVYALAVLGTWVARRVRVGRHRRASLAEHHAHEHHPDCEHPAVPHGDHLDYLHGDHLHHPHEGHYDERPLDASAPAPRP